MCCQILPGCKTADCVMKAGAAVDFHIVHLFPKGGSIEEPNVATDGANLTGSDGNVDVNDLQQFTENWLVGVSAP